MSLIFAKQCEDCEYYDRENDLCTHEQCPWLDTEEDDKARWGNADAEFVNG